MGMCSDPDLTPEADGIANALREPLLKTFAPALLGRRVTIPYYPLSDDMLGKIIRLQMERVVTRVRENHGAETTYSDDVAKRIAARRTEPESGVRMIDALSTNTVLPAMSKELLVRIAAGTGTATIDL